MKEKGKNSLWNKSVAGFAAKPKIVRLGKKYSRENNSNFIGNTSFITKIRHFVISTRRVHG